jgi:pimeloyl-ACP methyl ester carboxylesterase
MADAVPFDFRQHHGAARHVSAWCSRLLAGAMLSVTASPAVAAAAPELRFASVTGANGVPLTVAEAGPAGAPGILFLHGFGQTHLSFADQFADPALARDFHLVAVDLRGHGNSGKPWTAADYSGQAFAADVAAVMQATGLKRPVIVAWSFGGLVAMHYVRHHGIGNLAGINLVGTAGQLVPPPTTAGKAPVDMDWVRWILSDSLADNLRATERSVDLFTARPMPAAWRDRTLRAAMTMPAYARRAIGATPDSNTDLVAALRLPVLFTAGAQDAIAPLAAAEAAAAALPGARLSVYPDSGHSPFAEEPTRFNGELAGFVRAALATDPDPAKEVQQ